MSIEKHIESMAVGIAQLVEGQNRILAALSASHANQHQQVPQPLPSVPAQPSMPPAAPAPVQQHPAVPAQAPAPGYTQQPQQPPAMPGYAQQPQQPTPGQAPFTDNKGLMAYCMEKYRVLGPVKGGLIQNVLLDMGVNNINAVPVERYAEFYARVEAIQ